MSNSSQTYANGKSPSPPPPNTAASYPQPNSYPDLEAIRRAQREWRLAKRRELEAKAQKKQFKRASLSVSEAAPPQSVAHAQPHLNAAALYTQVAASQPTATQVQLPHGGVFTHSAEIQHLQMHPTSTAAIHQITQPHAQLMPQFKAPNVSSAAMVLQHHFNSNSKRARSAFEEVGLSSSPDDATDASMYAVAASGPVGMPTSIPMAGSVITTVMPSATLEGAIQHQQDAHKMAVDQYEAQRRWREMKRREMEMKKAKGAGSKRGRKKARISVPPAISAATAQLQESVSVAIAATPSIGATSAPMQITGQMGYERGGTTENVSTAVGGQASQMVEDPAAMYVKNAPSGDGVREVEDVGSEVREDGDNITVREVEENIVVREVEDGTAVGGIEDNALGEEVEDNAAVREAEGNTAVVEADDTTAVREVDGNDAVREIEDNTAVKGAEGNTGVKEVEESIEHRVVEDNTAAEENEDNAVSRGAGGNSTTEGIGDNAAAREAEDNCATPGDAGESGTVQQPMDVVMPTSDEVENTVQKETEVAREAVSSTKVGKHEDLSISTMQMPFAPATSVSPHTKFYSPIARPDFSEIPSKSIPAVTMAAESNMADADAKQEQSAQCDEVDLEGSKAIEDNSNIENMKKETEENIRGADESIAERGEREEAGEQEDFAAADVEIAPGEADRSKTFIRETSNAESTYSKENFAPRSGSGDEATKNKDRVYGAPQNAPKRREEERGPRELSEGDNNETQGARDGDTGDEADTDGKADEFPVSGEDIMSAVAWHSLDSIGNT